MWVVSQLVARLVVAGGWQRTGKRALGWGLEAILGPETRVSRALAALGGAGSPREPGTAVSRVPNAIEELRTDRLVLRRWRPGDKEAFARLNADLVVMEYFPSALDRAESDAFADRIQAGFVTNGYGLWAVELPGEADFIGYVGLAPANFEAHFTPAVEVGWRLARNYWGRGFATEAARAVVADGFDRVGLEKIVSFTVPANTRSVRVMEGLGMTRDPADDFDHPRLPVGHRLRRHVLYRLKRPTSNAGGSLPGC